MRADSSKFPLIRRRTLLAGAFALVPGLAGCTRVSEFIVDRVTGDVNLFNTIEEPLTGSLKKSRVGEAVDINAGTYIENAEIDTNVQIGPNCSVVGVTHELSEQGMTYRDDVFERIILHEGVFLGANAVVGPGVEVGTGTVVAAGATVAGDIAGGKIVLGTPPAQRALDLQDWLAESTVSPGRHD